LRKVLLPLQLGTNLEELELLGLLNTLKIQKAFSVSRSVLLTTLKNQEIFN